MKRRPGSLSLSRSPSEIEDVYLPPEHLVIEDAYLVVVVPPPNKRRTELWNVLVESDWNLKYNNECMLAP